LRARWDKVATEAVNPYAPGGAQSPFANPEPTTYTNERSRTSGNQWKRENREATIIDAEQGVISLDSPRNVTYANPNRNTTTATGTISHGFINTANSSMSGSWVGINWANVREVRGRTFGMQGLLKELGFRWNASRKVWVK